jgi:hypothetical protein
MTDEPGAEEGAEENVEDLEAPAEQAADVAGGRMVCPDNTACQLPTDGCSNPSCTQQTWCKPGTVQGCPKYTCAVTAVLVQ